jgi:hypothetical protein
MDRYETGFSSLHELETGMGEIEKVGNLKSENVSIENHLRITGIEKSCIRSVKISPFSMKKFEINELI